MSQNAPEAHVEPEPEQLEPDARASQWGVDGSPPRKHLMINGKLPEKARRTSGHFPNVMTNVANVANGVAAAMHQVPVAGQISDMMMRTGRPDEGGGVAPAAGGAFISEAPNALDAEAMAASRRLENVTAGQVRTPRALCVLLSLRALRCTLPWCALSRARCFRAVRGRGTPHRVQLH
eukprot:7093041-Prymnesium_polylepis.1